MALCGSLLLLQPKLSFPFDFERLLDDWVLLGFLIGNDFIPHLPYFHISEVCAYFVAPPFSTPDSPPPINSFESHARPCSQPIQPLPLPLPPQQHNTRAHCQDILPTLYSCYKRAMQRLDGWITDGAG